jgi:signal transduction histidine kinase
MIQFNLKNARILIVDDQVANVSLLQNMLNRIGYNDLLCVTDSREVMRHVEQFKPDLILLDINMPHLNGFEVMKQLAAVVSRERYLPVLVLTADVTSATKRKALASGATDLLHKPFDASEVFMRIRNLLETRFLHVEMEGKIAERTGQLQTALAELRDSQHQVMAQERLRAFSEMAGGVVHDFNNALMSVIGYSELLLQDHALLDDKPTVIDYLTTMNTAGRDASHVVSRLRDFYRPREKVDVFEALDLNDLAEQAVALTQPKWKDQALSTGRTIAVNLDLEKLPPVSGNAHQLREVLTNLIFNAVDAMSAGGAITLRSRRVADDVMLEVIDTGAGMSEEVRVRCLEPFFSTKGEHGTGLGLPMVFGIIKRHDGTLEIESEPGTGTTFRIRLPGQIRTFAPDDAGTARVGRSLDILVVDDEPVPRDVVSKYLTADGHRVVSAANGYDAFEKFKAGKFDLLLTDHAMPGMSGVQLAGAVKQLGGNQPVLLLTGFSDSSLAPGEKPAGIDLVLSKPIPQSELRRALIELMPAQLPRDGKSATG